MNRLDFIILSVLRQNEAVNRLSSMTVKEIASVENLGIKENTIFKKIRSLEQFGYVGRGLKESRADTFFITKDGLESLKKERGNEV